MNEPWKIVREKRLKMALAGLAETKECRKCKERKALTWFHKGATFCKLCRSTEDKERRSKLPKLERVKEQRPQWLADLVSCAQKVGELRASAIKTEKPKQRGLWAAYYRETNRLNGLVRETMRSVSWHPAIKKEVEQ